MFIDTRPYLLPGLKMKSETLFSATEEFPAISRTCKGSGRYSSGADAEGRYFPGDDRQDQRRQVRDPTGDAAAKLASHPSIKKIDELIEYWRLRKERVDQLLPLLNDKERAVIELYISKASEVQWPSMGRKELQQTRRQIIEKAARLWGLVQ